ncbi:MAG: hypothetical protein K6F53_05280 [Lachnospiraceae bacterium]|nr:hypothetical protein [Lachnospiraceae bacterium]
MKEKKTGGRRLIPVTAIMLAVFFALLFFILRFPCRDFLSAADRAFRIPDINYGFIPQGIAFDEESGLLFVTGHTDNHMAPPVYLLDPSDPSEVKTVRLMTYNGSAHRGQARGIAVYGDYVYVAGSPERYLTCFRREDFLSAKDGEGVRCIGEFETGISDTDRFLSDFLTVSDGKLYIGECAAGEGNEIPDFHTLKTGSGQENHAVIVAFPLSSEAPLGIFETPCEAYSIPDDVRGIAFYDGKAFLCERDEKGASYLSVFEPVPPEEGHIFRIYGTELPLYEIDSSCLSGSLRIPPVMNGITFLSGRLYLIGSSASNRTVYGKFAGFSSCFALDPSKVF